MCCWEKVVIVSDEFARNCDERERGKFFKLNFNDHFKNDFNLLIVQGLTINKFA